MGIGQQKKIQLVKMQVQTGVTGRRVEGAFQTYNLWAEISNVSGARDYLGNQTQFTNSKRFKVRFKFNLHPNCDWKVIYNGQEYTVTELNRMDEKRFYWQFVGTAKSNTVNV